MVPKSIAVAQEPQGLLASCRRAWRAGCFGHVMSHGTGSEQTLNSIDRTVLARAALALSFQTAVMLRKKAVLTDTEFSEVMATAASTFSNSTDVFDAEAQEFLLEQARLYER